MSRLLFENSKFALGFAGAVVMGAGIFAATSGTPNFAAKPGATPTEQAANGDKAPSKPKPGQSLDNQPDIADFAADENLIDNTTGFDPSPQEGVEVAELHDADDVQDSGFATSNTASGKARPSSPSPRQGSKAVTVPGVGAGGKPVKVTVNPGKGSNISISDNVKIRGADDYRVGTGDSPE